MNNECVCCGKELPEGYGQVCAECRRSIYGEEQRDDKILEPEVGAYEC